MADTYMSVYYDGNDYVLTGWENDQLVNYTVYGDGDINDKKRQMAEDLADYGETGDPRMFDNMLKEISESIEDDPDIDEDPIKYIEKGLEKITGIEAFVRRECTTKEKCEKNVERIFA
jgi:Fe-S-cluster formation regulator IscX/YfhJ